MATGVDKRAMAALSSGHLATDLANGALPALLPFLVLRFDLSYTLAGLVMLAWAFSSSVVQPFFGLWSDRRGAIWLLPAGLALGGVGIALVGVAPSYWAVLGLVTLSGLGTAAYHPEGSKFAAYASGERRASGMALFSLGGNVGYGLGPIVTTLLIVQLGLEGGLLLALPCVAMAVLLVALTPFLETFAPRRRPQRAAEAAGEDRPRAIALLLGVVAFRNMAWFGLITFVPLWEVARGESPAYANRLLALMLLAGGVGTLVAGPAADRLGRRPVLIASVVAMAPLILVYVTVGGVPGAVALALVGASVIGTFGVAMVMGQEYLPGHIGVASGLVVGLGIGLGGVAAVALGALADAVELRAALYLCAAPPLAALALAVLLPGTDRRRPLAPEPAVL